MERLPNPFDLFRDAVCCQSHKKAPRTVPRQLGWSLVEPTRCSLTFNGDRSTFFLGSFGCRYDWSTGWTRPLVSLFLFLALLDVSWGNLWFICTWMETCDRRWWSLEFFNLDQPASSPLWQVVRVAVRQHHLVICVLSFAVYPELLLLTRCLCYYYEREEHFWTSIL